MTSNNKDIENVNTVNEKRTMKPEKVYGPVGLAIVILALGIFLMIQPIDALVQSKEDIGSKQETSKTLEDELSVLEQEKSQEQANMNTLKPFYEFKGQISTDSLASFGDMLENIIDNYIKPNGIMVRSIDYTLDPPEDPISSNFSKEYHSCALELYLICKYSQLHDMLYSLINDFPYYISLSQLVITAYPADKEYLLVNMTLGLYVKKV